MSDVHVLPEVVFILNENASHVYTLTELGSSSSLSEQLPFEASSSVGDCSARCCQRASWFASLHGCRGEAARCT